MKRIVNAAVIIMTMLALWSSAISARGAAENGYLSQGPITVRGKVVDENNEPFVGVAILAKMATNGVITGVDGTFEINVLQNDELEFTFLGYETQIVKVDGRVLYSVTMLPQTSELDQVTVVAYGKQRKESVIGAISSINVDKISHSVNKLSNVLAGQMAGIVAVQRSGEPGSGSDFWIRGVSTFGANNKPLVLVDGIERDLNLVDPDDVETFSILKDATATAIYGVRGANGVVLITTRKGKESSKPVVNARVEASLLQPTKMPEMANAEEFINMYNYAYMDNRGGVFYDDPANAKYLHGSYPDLYPNIDWMYEIYKKATSSNRANVKIT
ncbi:MAG: SusC/RagA family TonB-linked outer membrane protein, partial [Bacteroidales bacterium]|nr:SusC/RagA family TonB-linked outer membrane protein [Bacteroidales bacterium]